MERNNQNNLAIMKKPVQSEHSKSVVFGLKTVLYIHVLGFLLLGVWLFIELSDVFLLGIFVFLAISVVCMMLYLNRKWVKVEINDKKVECTGLIFPFIRKVIWGADAEYFVTWEFETRREQHQDILLIKDGKIVATINTRWMLNVQEVMDALPWPSRGRYVPGALDSLRIGTINEACIQKK